MKKKIERVLVANRGEIAIRIFRACYDLGMKTIAVYSKEDVYNLFRTKADEAYLIGENKSPLGAYLDIDLIIDMALRRGADAIHPGYGFLSENEQLARACEDKGIIFIGPPSQILAQMGDKLRAKSVAAACGIPTIPGSDRPVKDLPDAEALAESCGYPIILKASAGGGGRGMRRVDTPAELAPALELVRNEARKAFNNSDIFIEKFLEEPKHIEVQILADEYGNIVHLHERDCSLQRRYQKVVEFAPAFSLANDKREKLCQDAVKIAAAAGYINAGTIEFLVDKYGNHYFIEMNPRIQVEHTVTEMVTGIDIVRSQILIACGHKLNSPEIGICGQDSVAVRGYSIQCRVTTEDPRNNFAPDTGKITAYRSGGGNGVRLDAGNAFTGAEISPYYDSLLVKITTHDTTFTGAARKALRSITEIRVRGVKTNIPFLSNILTHEHFKSGSCSTKFIDETPELFDFEDPRDRATKVLKYIGALIVNGEEKALYDKPRLPEIAGTASAGLKQLLDSAGPNAVVAHIHKENRLLLTDTTFRDAHQSLLATRVRTRDLLNVAEATSEILSKAFSLEMWGGATFDVAYRFLHESPWERLDLLRERIPNIMFQMLFRGANAVGYTNYPDNLIREFIRESARSGIDIFRIFDSLNWLPGMEIAIEEALLQNKLVEASICYTGDIDDPKRDKYSLNYYVNMAKELERRGTHILCIKDMAGLLKPYAAMKLIKSLKEEVGLPIHLHTHDTSGNQVAALLLAAQAGADIVDTAISSMSSLTSQPSMNAVVAALHGQERDTGFVDSELQKLTDYWEDVRRYYGSFEAGQISPATDIYRYEIPGGQYTNLKPQVESLGLGHKFAEVKEKYREVNYMLGDIVKVTPSSKMVGDLAIFMVQNGLTHDNILEKGEALAFPDSVVSYFRGMMGQPAWGFPEELQKLVLKGEKPISGRPGEMLDAIDFDTVKQHISTFCKYPTTRDVLSWCLYPKVFEDFYTHSAEYGYLSHMETHVFFMGMSAGEVTEINIEDGKLLIIKFVGLGDISEDGLRSVIFELNGARREVMVPDNSAEAVISSTVLANPDDRTQIASAIPGAVSKLLVKTGEAIRENQVVAIIEAMKMETSVVSRIDGIISDIRIEEGQSVKAGELLMTLSLT